MLENTFKTGLVKELKSRFPGCIVLHADPNEIQGIPDLVVLYEVSKSISSPKSGLLCRKDERDELCCFHLPGEQGGDTE